MTMIDTTILPVEMHRSVSPKMSSRNFARIVLILILNTIILPSRSTGRLQHVTAWVEPMHSRQRRLTVIVSLLSQQQQQRQQRICNANTDGTLSRRKTYTPQSQESLHGENSLVLPEIATTTTATNLLDTLLLWFQGDFDNYRQVVIDRAAGLLPREYGGHEHIHCSLIPVTYTTRLAAFYFDGTPQAIFRFRFYQLRPTTTDGTTVDTILYTLSKDLEKKLRACTDAMQWPGVLIDHVTDHCNDNDVCRSIGSYNIDEDIVDLAVQSSSVTMLPKCDVRWSWERDLIQHSYVASFADDIIDKSSNCDSNSDMLTSGIHAVMVHGEALVNSQMIPGQKILIKDQLSLWHNQLWIHDRGYDPVTGAYIYGNQNGIPYRMQRVTDIAYIDDENAGSSNNSDTSLPVVTRRRRRRRQLRVVSDSELAWTLGNDYRTQVEYETNMQVIGGSSRKQ